MRFEHRECVCQTHSLGVGLNQSDTDGEADEAGHIMDLKSFHQLTPVCLDGFDAQIETLGHIFRGMPFCNQLQHFALARTELA